MISLLHTNETGDFFLYADLRIVPGNEHECPILREMVAEFTSPRLAVATDGGCALAVAIKRTPGRLPTPPATSWATQNRPPPSPLSESQRLAFRA